MGQVAPVGDLARDVVRDAADGEVRVGVGHDHGDLGGRIELARPQRGADAGVTASDGYEVHEDPFDASRSAGLEVVLAAQVRLDDVGRLGFGHARVQALDQPEGHDAADDLGGDEARDR